MKKQKRIHHHIVNRCNGGKSCPSNLLFIKENREKSFHNLFGSMTLKDAGFKLIYMAKEFKILFGDMTLEEAGNLLLRTARLKKRQQ